MNLIINTNKFQKISLFAVLGFRKLEDSCENSSFIVQGPSNVVTLALSLLLFLSICGLLLDIFLPVPIVINLLFLSIFTAMLWIYETQFLFIYLVYILAFIGAVLILFLSVVLILPISVVYKSNVTFYLSILLVLQPTGAKSDQVLKRDIVTLRPPGIQGPTRDISFASLFDFFYYHSFIILVVTLILYTILLFVFTYLAPAINRRAFLRDIKVWYNICIFNNLSQGPWFKKNPTTFQIATPIINILWVATPFPIKYNRPLSARTILRTPRLIQLSFSELASYRQRYDFFVKYYNLILTLITMMWVVISRGCMYVYVSLKGAYTTWRKIGFYGLYLRSQWFDIISSLLLIFGFFCAVIPPVVGSCIKPNGVNKSSVYNFYTESSGEGLTSIKTLLYEQTNLFLVVSVVVLLVALIGAAIITKGKK